MTVHRATAPFTVAGKKLSRRLLRREVRAGVPAARARHVRAAGSSRRHSVSRAARRPALRQRRLDAGLPDGRQVRPPPRRVRRPVRKAERPAEAGAREGHDDRDGGIHVQPCGERLVYGHQPAAGRRRRRELADVGSAARSVLRRDQGLDRRRGGQARGRPRPQLRGRVGATRRRGDQAPQAPDCPGGSVRRLDALGLDALAAGAVRVSVRGRVPPGARCAAISPAASTSSSFRPAWDRRRPAADVAGAAAAVAVAAARRRCRGAEYPGPVSEPARGVHRGPDGSAA